MCIFENVYEKSPQLWRLVRDAVIETIKDHFASQGVTPDPWKRLIAEAMSLLRGRISSETREAVARTIRSIHPLEFANRRLFPRESLALAVCELVPNPVQRYYTDGDIVDILLRMSAEAKEALEDLIDDLVMEAEEVSRDFPMQDEEDEEDFRMAAGPRQHRVDDQTVVGVAPEVRVFSIIATKRFLTTTGKLIVAQHFEAHQYLAAKYAVTGEVIRAN